MNCSVCVMMRRSTAHDDSRCRDSRVDGRRIDRRRGGSAGTFPVGLRRSAADGRIERAGRCGVVFDKPDGRIIERYASGPLTADSVYAFYSETLPQLGWQARPDKRAKHLVFEREGESLDIEFKKVGSELVARFSVAPG